MSLLDVLKSKDKGVIDDIEKDIVAVNKPTPYRGHGLNSPSSVSRCPREVYYRRKGLPNERVREASNLLILDVGTFVHEKVQEALLAEGHLIIDEVPLYHEELQIMGHADGLIDLKNGELGVLELKTINDNGYRRLADAKHDHKEQTFVYLFIIENLRKQIEDATNKTVFQKEYLSIIKEALEAFIDTSTIKGERKVAKELKLHKKLFNTLKDCHKPIHTISVVYINRNNFAMKKFDVEFDIEAFNDITKKLIMINEAVENNKVPKIPSEQERKALCRWCEFKESCLREF